MAAKKKTVDKNVLADLQNDLEKGYRLFKIYERGIEVVETLRALEFNKEKAEKEITSIDEDLKTRRANAEKVRNEVDEQVAAHRQKEKEAKKKAEGVVSAAEEKAIQVMKDAETAAKKYVEDIKASCAAEEKKRDDAKKEVTKHKGELTKLQNKIKTEREALEKVQQKKQALIADLQK